MTGNHHVMVNGTASLCLLKLGLLDHVDVIGLHDATAVFLCLGLVILGGLLPDIDSKRSLLGRYVYLPITHRTLTHSIWIPLILCLGGIFLWWPLLWLAFGWLIHLFCDAFSRAGVAWFWPITGYRRYGNGAFVAKNHHMKFYASASKAESVTAIVLMVLFVLGTLIIPYCIGGCDYVRIF